MKDFQTLFQKLADVYPKLKRYTPLLFIVLVVAIYGFLLYRINSLDSANPSAQSVADQNKVTQVPHVDSKLINQLQSLQDNSSSVHSLFDQARNNPFQE